MSVRNLVILGSTGSIGRSTLDVVAGHPGKFRLRALAAHSNVSMLRDQYKRFRPEYLCLADLSAGERLASELKDEPVRVVVGEDELVNLATLPEVDLVVNAVVGAAGLRVSVETVKQGRNLALANKESLVAGGPLFAGLCEKNGARILPIDSEHSAIWQVLSAGKESEVKTIILTSSGGPFRTLPAEQFENISVDQALSHPTWKMGPKISIDSATLVNKGLEVIEAVALFSMPVEMVKVVIHPESIIHSMVEFCDSSVIAQLSKPDMRLPITYALFWPDRVESDFGRIDWSELKSLTFEEPDFTRFPALGLAFEVAGRGGTSPAVYNAANEIAVQAFLDGVVKFIEITDIIKNTVETVDVVMNPDLDDILTADRRAREIARQTMEKPV